MKAKINKALDYNKLLEDQKKGKLLKKRLSYPMAVSIKYDGNYVAVRVEHGVAMFTTSGGLNYNHLDLHPFNDVLDGVYLAERIFNGGQLGDRNKCNLRGPKTAQTSVGHNYKVFDFITLEAYDRGFSSTSFVNRYTQLCNSRLDKECIVETKYVTNREQLDDLLVKFVKLGFEGVMAVQLDQLWEDTKSRRVDFIKYKKRRTADLLCIDTTEGEGKYVGVTGALVLQDSEGRVVSVGSGLSDEDRCKPPSHFIGKIVEIRYDKIDVTYIQPSFVRVREDKNECD